MVLLRDRRLASVEAGLPDVGGTGRSSITRMPPRPGLIDTDLHLVADGQREWSRSGGGFAEGEIDEVVTDVVGARGGVNGPGPAPR